MRLFVALDLEPGILAQLRQALTNYRQLAPNAHWTRVESLHLTLKFIGEVDPAREAEIIAALRGLQQAEFPLHLAGLGVFPQPRRPRVFWAGIQPSIQLAHLAQTIESALLPLGIPAEERAFSPHLTLARGHSPADLLPLVPLLRPDQPHWGHQTVREFHLYQSYPVRGLYQYEKRTTFPLAGE